MTSRIPVKGIPACLGLLLVATVPAEAGYNWSVTNPVVGQTYSVTNIPIDATVSWTHGVDHPVTGIDIEVLVRGINRRGAGGNLQYITPAQGSLRIFGWVTVSTQFPNDPATVRFKPMGATAPILNADIDVDIQLKP